MTSPFFSSTFKGLNTETNPNRLVPWTFSQAKDVVFSREDQIYARHGHPQVPFVVGSPTPYPFTNASATIAKSLFSYDNLGTTVYLVRYVTSGALDCVYLFTGNTLSTAVPSDQSTVTSYATGKLIDIVSVPRTFVHDENVFMCTNNGMYTARLSFSGGPSRIVFPKFLHNGSQFFAYNGGAANTSDAQWFATGKAVSIRISFTKEVNSTSGSRIIESAPSEPLEFINITGASEAFGGSTSTLGDLKIDSATYDSAYTVVVYRTVQYPIGQTPPEQYYKCFEKSLIGATTLPTMHLSLNDDGIRTFEQLYTNPSQQGAENTNHVPPPCRDVTELKNYYFYADFVKPTVATFALTSLPENYSVSSNPSFAAYAIGGPAITDSTFTLKFTDPVGGTFEKTITFKDNITANLGPTDCQIATNAAFEGQLVPTTLLSARAAADVYNTGERSLSWSGISHALADTINPEDRVLRIAPGKGVGQVKPYALISNFTVAGTGSAKNVTVTISSYFDRQKFAEPGLAASVDPTTGAGLGKIVSFFSYQTITHDASAGTFTFTGCVGIGLSTYISSNAVYYIPGSSLTAASIYSASSGGTVNSYFSLLPAELCDPTPIAVPYTNGQVFPFSYSTDLLTPVQYIGLTKKTQAALLDKTVNNLINSLDYSLGSTGTITKRDDLNAFDVEILDYQYETIYAKTNNVAVFQPLLTTSYVEQIRAEEVKNGLCYSKQNNPESVPLSTLLSPLYVGNKNNKILRIMSTQDSLYVFKENEGIFKVSVSDAGLLPSIGSSVLLTNTTWLIAPESLQNVNNSLYFLSNKGFVKLDSNSIEPVGESIETDVKTLTSKATLANVRSFGNKAKRLYGCYFPAVNSDGSGVTYVFDTYTKEWSTWDLPFDAAITDSFGKMTSLATDYTLTGNPTTTATIDAAVVSTTNTFQYLRQDVYTSNDPLNAADQYDESLTATITSATLDAGTGLYTVLVTAGAVNTSPVANLRHFSYRLKNKQLYFKTIVNGVANTIVPVTVTGVTGTANAASVSTLSFTLPDTTTSTAGTGTGTLYVGVNMELTTNLMHAGNPSSLKRFSEFQVHTSNVPSRLTGSFKGYVSSSFTSDTIFDIIPANNKVFRALVPRDAHWSTYLISKVKHNVPLEQLTITGLSIKLRDIDSSRVNKV